ncbi:MAG: 7-cyano-7-deazaguanine synthase QueC [Syntrophomonadaceae bacterium]|jgi:7-cyano-7-deazaguanine synthase|nr:7-cyano-7-deazaguanine synthase QueC [Syntrophomonadaceae bacterium]
MKAVALLSGGLDSVVSMLLASKEVEIVLAITVDYGQRAAKQEIAASQRIAHDMGIPHKVICLPFMMELNSDLLKPDNSCIVNPWVPNRNGLLISLAACLAENLGAQMVICGFNREEAAIFPDNSSSFIEAVNSALSYSTRNHVFAKSFVQNMTKEDIVRQALLLDVNLDSLWSCYQDGDEPCGGCSSCITNQDAFRKVGIR